MGLETLIPGIDFPHLDTDTGSSDPRRITLIKKTEDNLTFIASRGLEPIQYDTPISDAFLIEIYNQGKRVSTSYHESISFNRKQVGDISYCVISGNTGVETTKPKQRKVSYVFPEELASTITDGALDGQVSALLSLTTQYTQKVIASISKKGLVRTIFGSEPEHKKLAQEKRAINKQIYETVSALFREEPYQEKVSKFHIATEDRKCAEAFKCPSVLKSLAIATTAGPVIFSIMPSNLVDYAIHKLQQKANRKFEFITDPTEQDAVALSEYALVTPGFISGIKRGVAEAKLYSDLLLFSGQVASTAYLAHNAPWWISVPYAIPNVVSAGVRLRNAYQSGGVDFSGIISSVFSKAVNEMLSEDKYKSKPRPKNKD